MSTTGHSITTAKFNTLWSICEDSSKTSHATFQGLSKVRTTNGVEFIRAAWSGKLYASVSWADLNFIFGKAEGAGFRVNTVTAHINDLGHPQFEITFYEYGR